MRRSSPPRYLLYSTFAGLAVITTLLLMFLAQQRWVTDEIISSGSQSFATELRRVRESQALSELQIIAAKLRSADNPETLVPQLENEFPQLIALRLVATAENTREWQADELTLRAPLSNMWVEARFRFSGENLARFSDEMRASRDASASVVIWIIVAGALAFLATAASLTMIVARRFVARIHQLKLEAEKLRESDFGEPITTNREDELGQLAAVFNDMRDKLRLTTHSRDYVDSILSSMNDAIIVTGADGRIKRINKATSSMLGYEHDELVNTCIDQIVNTKKSGSLADEEPSDRPREAFFISKNGESVPVSFTCSLLDGNEAETGDRVFSAQNTTERRKAEKRIRYLARMDALTKVPNRMQFQHLLQRSIARARRTNRPICLLYLDIDHFKEINDTFGHLAGDKTLETVADRLNAVLPSNTVIGRLAGDEFAVMIDGSGPEGPERKKLDALANKLLQELAHPLLVQGHEVFMTASMGIAFYPRDAANVIDLIRNADAALYSAKKSGGNQSAEYRPEMNEAAVERLMTKSKLKRAFERDELRVLYQPKYNMETGQVFGAEALVRWETPERGMILPSDFIPIAEESNLIIEIGEWVLDKVCEDFRYWQRSVSSPGRISVNLSLKQLRQRNFSERVGAILRSYEVSPTSLELEITETTLMENPERTIRLLDELYALGLHLSIDDFGTGYSSLSALQQFPISTLKIDRSFVRDVAHNQDAATIVSTVVQMGKNLELDVVAEGVETEDQLAFLQTLGCHYVQGLLFGNPMSSDDYLELQLAQLEGTDSYRALFV